MTNKINKYNLEIDNCKFGNGVFTRENIPKGAVILHVDGTEITFDEAIKLGDLESYPFQIGAETYLLPFEHSLWKMINHSCAPNCGINGKLEIVTLRELQAGEELSFDYSTTMFERHWTMDCMCGLSLCRKLIGDFDSVPEFLQKFYIKNNFVQPYILDLLNA